MLNALLVNTTSLPGDFLTDLALLHMVQYTIKAELGTPKVIAYNCDPRRLRLRNAVFFSGHIACGSTSFPTEARLLVNSAGCQIYFDVSFIDEKMRDGYHQWIDTGSVKAQAHKMWLFDLAHHGKSEAVRRKADSLFRELYGF